MTEKKFNALFGDKSDGNIQSHMDERRAGCQGTGDEDHRSKLKVVDVDTRVARKAGELRLKHNMPTADSLIAATGVVVGATHVLTEVVHFNLIASLLKRVSLRRVKKMI